MGSAALYGPGSGSETILYRVFLALLSTLRLNNPLKSFSYWQLLRVVRDLPPASKPAKQPERFSSYSLFLRISLLQSVLPSGRLASPSPPRAEITVFDKLELTRATNTIQLTAAAHVADIYSGQP